MDDRAQMHIHFVIFFASLIIAAVLYIFFEPMAQTMLDTAGGYTTTSDADQGQNYVSWAFQSMHWLVLGLGVLYLIVAAVFESEVSFR